MNAPLADAVVPSTRAGFGLVRTALVAGRSAVVRAKANSPLKLLAPRRRPSGAAHSAWVFSSTYGGGLVAGDCIGLDVRVGTGSCLLLSTQASTKVYRATGDRPSGQSLDATVEPDAALVVAPDPVTCFAGADYEQRQTFHVAAGGSLVLLDWLTSGRRARGERWAFRRYRTRTEVFTDGRLVLSDRLLLDRADGPIDAPHRLGRFECLAMLVILGPAFEADAGRLLKEVAARPLRRGESLVDCASPMPGGAVLRVAGQATEPVGRYLRDALRFVAKGLGEDLWARKW